MIILLYDSIYLLIYLVCMHSLGHKEWTEAILWGGVGFSYHIGSRGKPQAARLIAIRFTSWAILPDFIYRMKDATVY